MSKGKNSGKGIVTIAQVAAAAGVATSTVSRALTQPDRVSASMVKRVRAVAQELGYYPNTNARSLKSGRTHTMALLIPGVTNPYFFDLIRGTQIEAKTRGYRHMLFDTEAQDEIERRVLAELPGAVDGAVVAGSRLEDEDLLKISERLPMVVVNRAIKGMQSVVVDSGPAVTTALDYLHSLGHHRIAYLGGPKGSWSNRKRWEALSAASMKLGVECLHLGSFDGMDAGAAAADAAIESRVTACIFFNDMLAISALQRFAFLGVSVPEDISIIGCDGIFGSDFCNPPLTTLIAPIDEVARKATEILLSRLAAPSTVIRNERVSAYLAVRKSAGPVRRNRD